MAKDVQISPLRSPRSPKTSSAGGGGESSINLSEKTIRTLEQYRQEDFETIISAKRKLKKAELKPFPTFQFGLLIIVDIIDIFFGASWIGSVIFNILIGIFVSNYVMGRVNEYKQTLDNAIKLSKKLSRMGGKSMRTKMTRVVAKVVKKAAGNSVTKATRKKIVIFIIYGVVPILQILASWAFFMFMYYKKEKQLVVDINEAIEELAQAQAREAANFRDIAA